MQWFNIVREIYIICNALLRNKLITNQKLSLRHQRDGVHIEHKVHI